MVAPDEGAVGRPENNVYTFLLVVAFIFMLAGTVFTMMELNKVYKMEFGGLMSVEGKAAPAPAKK